MLAKILHRLPAFEPQRMAESLRRLRTLEDGMGEIRQDTRAILKQVQEVREEQVQAQLSVEDRKEKYERRYLAAVAHRLDYVELFGADIRPETRQQSLSIAYIPLTVEDNHGGGEPVGFESLLVKLVADSKPLLLLGEAGSGKSTLLRWTAVTTALRIDEFKSRRTYFKILMSDARKIFEVMISHGGESESSPLARIDFRRSSDSVDMAVPTGIGVSAALDALPRSVSPRVVAGVGLIGRRCVPFLLRLRDCQDGRLPPPQAWPEMVANEIGAPPDGWVEEMLAANRGLILLDGIDEIPDARRLEARRAIKALLQAHEGNLFLISSRPAAIDEGWFMELDLERVRINPMSDPDRELFIDKWHEALVLCPVDT